MSVILTLSEQYRQRLRQASWRMQYRAKTRLYHENLSLNEQIHPVSVKFDDMNTVIVQQWIDSLPWEKARYIMTYLYMEGQSEQELAAKLHISQQAVNRWKRKSIQFLSQTSNL
ncbi:sigma-70 family RNA polymerase sigma factor [Paenibacillus wenxiniae]|uniref:Sigma-70 family RNA polymerase sigma factor n=1 Tax=Paenibacillus wenxiniae TaxID=1636843 RepID=A0ABW4RLM6_9BACL